MGDTRLSLYAVVRLDDARCMAVCGNFFFKIYSPLYLPINLEQTWA